MHLRTAAADFQKVDHQRFFDSPNSCARAVFTSSRDSSYLSNRPWPRFLSFSDQNTRLILKTRASALLFVFNYF
jgi:hypothetical protein